MATNNNFCKPTEDAKGLIYAPVVLAPNPWPPSEEEYNAAGWYRKAVVPPTPPEGKIVKSITYQVVDRKVVAEYEYEDAPARIRTFSKYKLYLVLTEMGLWEPFENWLKNTTILGRNAFTAFSIANDLTDENQMFKGLLDDVKTALGVTDEQVENILTASEI